MAWTSGRVAQTAFTFGDAVRDEGQGRCRVLGSAQPQRLTVTPIGSEATPYASTPGPYR